ncbi:neuropeptide Y receptor type 6-like [Dendronephthya gigantea]|uniref:neuropeptide Y receptor type 6-like n=1 Tax=Dendronephthya gigantea TaxID=151771 RepID=UPI00106B334E|nr:neuropeptide Y receptor type 6-like [Dendronephthya gigantea]
MVNGTEEERFLSSPAIITLSAVTALILLLDLVGNTLVLCVVYRQRMKPNLRVGNMFIANLSVIDLLMGIFLIPMSMAVTLLGRKVLTDERCKFNGFFNVFVGSASIWTLAVISIDRYRAIVSPPGKRLQMHHARWLLIAVWIASLMMAFAPMGILGEYKLNTKSTNCRPIGQSYVLLLSVASFLLPFVTMTYCYMKIYLKVRKQRIQLQSWKSNNSHMRTELKTAKIVFTVLAVFLVCWLPFVTVYILLSIGKAQNISPAVFLLSGCLTAAHSICNPVIYFTMNKVFRNDLFSMFPGLRKLCNIRDMITNANHSNNVVVELNAKDDSRPCTVNS